MSMTLTDPVALAASGMGFLDRLSVRIVAGWPAWLGRSYLHTSVRYDASGDVLHTTVVRWLGIPFQKSVETMHLDPEGRRFTVSGGMTGTGSIDESGTRAEYALEWLGAPLRQTTVREADVVTVTQEGPGFTGLQVLQRQTGGSGR